MWLMIGVLCRSVERGGVWGEGEEGGWREERDEVEEAGGREGRRGNGRREGKWEDGGERRVGGWMEEEKGGRREKEGKVERGSIL